MSILITPKIQTLKTCETIGDITKLALLVLDLWSCHKYHIFQLQHSVHKKIHSSSNYQFQSIFSVTTRYCFVLRSVGENPETYFFVTMLAFCWLESVMNVYTSKNVCSMLETLKKCNCILIYCTISLFRLIL